MSEQDTLHRIDVSLYLEDACEATAERFTSRLIDVLLRHRRVGFAWAVSRRVDPRTCEPLTDPNAAPPLPASGR